MEEVEVEGRDSFHPEIPMKWAFFEDGGRMEGREFGIHPKVD
jgi:hypothetical protein